MKKTTAYVPAGTSNFSNALALFAKDHPELEVDGIKIDTSKNPNEPMICVASKKIDAEHDEQRRRRMADTLLRRLEWTHGLHEMKRDLQLCGHWREMIAYYEQNPPVVTADPPESPAEFFIARLRFKWNWTLGCDYGIMRDYAHRYDENQQVFALSWPMEEVNPNLTALNLCRIRAISPPMESIADLAKHLKKFYNFYTDNFGNLRRNVSLECPVPWDSILEDVLFLPAYEPLNLKKADQKQIQQYDRGNWFAPMEVLPLGGISIVDAKKRLKQYREF